MQLFRVLVFGGRTYHNYGRVTEVLDTVHQTYQDRLLIIQGAARGADLLAEEWAKERQVPYLGVPARWDRFGKAAGRERNKRMPTIMTPDAAIGFPGGTGSANMQKVLQEVYNIEPWMIE